MSLIEGVGDEVTVFFIVAWVLLIGWIAWCSTNISEQPLIRTVLILQHRTRSRIAELRAHSQTITAIIGSTDGNSVRRLNVEESTSEENVETSNVDNEAQQTCPTNQRDVSPQVPSEDTNLSQASAAATTTTTTTTGATEEEVLIEAMDSSSDDTNEGRNKKLLKPNVTSTTNSDSSKNDYSQLDSTPSSSPADSVDGDNINEGDEITIKLKYINDDQKIVTARPKEMLGNFIRRNFQVELNDRKRIRLIFNGHVLHPENDTLEQFGLYDNCVVHCLVHQQRIQSNNSETSQTTGNDGSSIYTDSQGFQNIQTGTGLPTVHNEWDLGRLLVSVLTFILVFAWYSRYHYAQLFTVTTSLALYVLTAIFTLFVVGHFFPDQDSIRNIE